MTGARRVSHPEADIQRAIVSALRVVLPPSAVVHASGHEQRGRGPDWARRQALLTGMGACKGWPDLVILAGGRVAFLEVKSATGRLTESQAEVRGRLVAQGHHYAVVRSVDEALSALAEAGVTTRVKGGRA